MERRRSEILVLGNEGAIQDSYYNVNLCRSTSKVMSAKSAGDLSWKDN